MANIRIDLNHLIHDGFELTLKAPCDCNEVTGLKIYTPDVEGGKEYPFADANGNDISNLDNLFVKDSMVQVLINNDKAQIINGDTNGYLERKLEKVETLESDVEGIRKQVNEHAHFRGYKATDEQIQEIEATPNDFAYSAESGTKWVYDEVNGWVDTGTPVPDQLTPASGITPLMNGSASVGKEEAYARGDHRHPTDTTRASATELNKLKDEITPIITSDVIKNIDKHYWKRQAVDFTIEVASSDITIYVYDASNSSTQKTLYYADSVSVVTDDSGVFKVILNNPTKLTYNWDGGGTASRAPVEAITGKYWSEASDGSALVYYTKTLNKYVNNVSGRYYATVAGAIVSASTTLSDDAEYIYDEDENAYPTGIVDNYLYTYMGTPENNILSPRQPETGTYKGTGTYGYDSPNQLTFGFEPKFIFVKPLGSISVERDVGFCWIASDTDAFTFSELGAEYRPTATVAGNTISWYNAKSADYQLNRSGYTYVYFAMG